MLGGLIPSGTFVATTPTMHAYTVSTNTWTTKASMATSRNDLTAVALNGVIYAMSGQSSSAVEAYDIATNGALVIVDDQGAKHEFFEGALEILK